ncbi:transporter [Christiangramia fulva]|uniref:Transporter n=1 Tax=Christiangramia fulva TaxID=2126553 RepID=A0A2R3Z1C3_9FLAO|nr:transporter [Christiangramia fulva]AVR44067.1 transporter [Christiangramia fulva]
MRKFFILFIFVGTAQLALAQDLPDIYRYSSEELSGTARYIGMSGAFGALGGDMSAVSINPASSAVFLSSSANITLGFRGIKNDISYSNGRTSSDNSTTDLSNLGGVFIFNNTSGGDFKKLSLAINYQTTRTFDENYIARGVSQNSIDQYFLNYANGLPLNLLQRPNGESIDKTYSNLGETYGFGAQQAFLGYQAYVIEAETNDPENSSYYSLIDAGNFDQRFNYAATGLNGKLSFNIGTQFQDFLYLGLNLNSHFINYESSEEISEFNDNPESETTEVYFGNNLSTNGDGFSFQLGGIFKADNWRFGVSYDSPIWYNIREETSQYIETNSYQDEYVSIAPNVINTYPEYRLQTPSKISGSLAYLFGKSGLISFEYGLKDYSSMKLKPVNDPSFAVINQDINQNMQASSSYKIGGEYRVSRLSFRAGYRFVESPFKSDNGTGDLTGYTAGLGYDFGSLSLNAAYSLATYKEKEPLLNTGLTQPVLLDRDLSKVVISLNFGL